MEGGVEKMAASLLCFWQALLCFTEHGRLCEIRLGKTVILCTPLTSPNSPNSAKLNYHQALETVKLALNEKNPAEKQRLFDTAGAGFEQAIKIYPSYADAHGELGLNWFRKGDVNKALASYTEALNTQPGKSYGYTAIWESFISSKIIWRKPKKCIKKHSNTIPDFWMPIAISALFMPCKNVLMQLSLSIQRD